MKRVPVGTTDMSLTRVGFGASSAGGGGCLHGWGAKDDDASVAAIRAALEAGVNWIDTAPMYGLALQHPLGGGCLAPAALSQVTRLLVESAAGESPAAA